MGRLTNLKQSWGDMFMNTDQAFDSVMNLSQESGIAFRKLWTLFNALTIQAGLSRPAACKIIAKKIKEGSINNTIAISDNWMRDQLEEMRK